MGLTGFPETKLMNAERFLDTNILLYALSTAPEEAHKKETARSLLESRDLGLSVQVLQEFYVQATRQSRPDPISHNQALRLIESFLRFPVQVVDVGVLRAALATREKHGISLWDAAIVEAARALGCRLVLSEDLNHGQDYSGVRVLNPFQES